jgi:hypothetical protein
MITAAGFSELLLGAGLELFVNARGKISALDSQTRQVLPWPRRVFSIACRRSLVRHLSGWPCDSCGKAQAVPVEGLRCHSCDLAWFEAMR